MGGSSSSDKPPSPSKEVKDNCDPKYKSPNSTKPTTAKGKQFTIPDDYNDGGDLGALQKYAFAKGGGGEEEGAFSQDKQREDGHKDEPPSDGGDVLKGKHPLGDDDDKKTSKKKGDDDDKKSTKKKGDDDDDDKKKKTTKKGKPKAERYAVKDIEFKCKGDKAWCGAYMNCLRRAHEAVKLFPELKKTEGIKLPKNVTEDIEKACKKYKVDEDTCKDMESSAKKGVLFGKLLKRLVKGTESRGARSEDNSVSLCVCVCGKL